MSDPIEVTARATAAQLAAEHGPGVVAEVDAALHARRRAERRSSSWIRIRSAA